MSTPKAVPYMSVGFGTRPQRLKVSPTGKPYKPPSAEQRYRAMKKVAVTPNPVAAGQVTKTIPTEPTPPGRPPSNLGQYLIKPVDDTDTGFEMINAEPELIHKVNTQYLKAGKLPPALQPKYLRKPEVMEANRAKNISRGWRKPRSQQG